VLYNKDDASKGKFAFTTEEYDMFEICFESRIPLGNILSAVYVAFLALRPIHTERVYVRLCV